MNVQSKVQNMKNENDLGVPKDIDFFNIYTNLKSTW